MKEAIERFLGNKFGEIGRNEFKVYCGSDNGHRLNFHPKKAYIGKISVGDHRIAYAYDGNIVAIQEPNTQQKNILFNEIFVDVGSLAEQEFQFLGEMYRFKNEVFNQLQNIPANFNTVFQ